jgi:hypothetical protein
MSRLGNRSQPQSGDPFIMVSDVPWDASLATIRQRLAPGLQMPWEEVT